jgi:uncharacterized membrane protein
MRGRWMLVGLIVSVALNLFLIGAAAGVVALGARMARLNATDRPGVMVQATARLPQPDRRNMRLMLRQVGLDARPAVAQSRALRLQAWTAIAEARPDAALIKLKLAQSRQLDLATRAEVEEKVADYVLALPASDRAILADGFRRALPGPPPPPPSPAGAKPLSTPQ